MSRCFACLIGLSLLLELGPIQLPAATWLQNTQASVPPYIRFSGTVRNADGTALAGVVGLTFALYDDPQSRSPLWLEVQNVNADEKGRYSVLLGSRSQGGIPPEIFSPGEARWLGVQTEDGTEGPRVLLVSVPYAFKAAEAERLAGRAASDFVTTDQLTSQVRDELTKASTLNSSGGADDAAPAVVTASGTTGHIAKFTDTETLSDSVLFENNGNIGLNTTSPASRLHVTDNNNFQMAIIQSLTTGSAGLSFRNPAQNWVIGVRADLGNALSFRNVTESRDSVTLSRQDAVGGTTLDVNGRLRLVGSSDLQIASFESSINGNAGFGFKNPTQNWGVGLRFDRSHAFVIRNISAARDDFTFTTTGRLGIGTVAPSQVLEVVGNIKITGAGSGLVLQDGSTLASTNALRTRGITFIAGCDTCSVLLDSDDQRTVYQNVIGAMTITEVTCISDDGTPTINLQRDNGDGTPADILSSSLECSTAGAVTTSLADAEDNLGLSDRIDFVMVTAGGVAKRVTVIIKAVLD